MKEVKDSVVAIISASVVACGPSVVPVGLTVGFCVGSVVGSPVEGIELYRSSILYRRLMLRICYVHCAPIATRTLKELIATI